MMCALQMNTLVFKRICFISVYPVPTIQKNKQLRPRSWHSCVIHLGNG